VAYFKIYATWHGMSATLLAVFLAKIILTMIMCNELKKFIRSNKSKHLEKKTYLMFDKCNVFEALKCAGKVKLYAEQLRFRIIVYLVV